MWGQVCSGKNLSYNPTGSGAGVEQFIAKQVDFAGSDSALKDDQVEGRGRPLRRQPGVEPAAGVRPRRDGLQHRGRRQAGASTATCSPRSSRARSPSGTTRRSPRSTAAPPCRTPTSPRSTARTPRAPPTTSRSTWRAAAPQAWTKGAGKEFQGGAGEGAQKSAGVVQAVQATPGAIGYVEKGFAAAGRPAVRPDRQRRRRGRADRRDGRRRPSTPPSSPPRATT